MGARIAHCQLALSAQIWRPYKWYLDEVFLTINDERYDLWRVVDQEDPVLDILVLRRGNKTAAKKCFKQLIKGCSTDRAWLSGQVEERLEC